MIKLLIVEDSPTQTLVLKQIFESEGDIEVIACAKDGLDAVKLVEKLRPDVITMDIEMPVIDGIEATKRIMATCPTPIVVISSKLSDAILNGSFRALEAGALAVLDKPSSVSSPDANCQIKEMISTVRAMADIRVVKRRFVSKSVLSKKSDPVDVNIKTKKFELIAMGASAGGPQALKHILSSLPENFPLPILVVQHMTAGFMQGFVEWLGAETKLKIKSAEHGEPLHPGCVYFAPDHYHLEVARSSSQLIAKLLRKDPYQGFCPSVSVLFKSVAAVSGNHALAVLLTGMGSDGADGMLEIRQVNGHTIIQDQKSAVVFGMPGVALSLNAVDKILSLEQIADYLVNVTKQLS